MKIFASLPFYDEDNNFIGYGRDLEQEDMDEIARWMDDDIREDLHLEMAPCSPEEFIVAYLKRDPEFMDTLTISFDMDEDELEAMIS